MKLIKQCRTIEAYTFEPQIELTLSFRLEVLQELQGLYSLDMQQELELIYGKELLLLLDNAMTELVKKV